MHKHLFKNRAAPAKIEDFENSQLRCLGYSRLQRVLHKNEKKEFKKAKFDIPFCMRVPLGIMYPASSTYVVPPVEARK
jgi:hypothetical protein